MLCPNAPLPARSSKGQKCTRCTLKCHPEMWACSGVFFALWLPKLLSNLIYFAALLGSVLIGLVLFRVCWYVLGLRALTSSARATAGADGTCFSLLHVFHACGLSSAGMAFWFSSFACLVLLSALALRSFLLSLLFCVPSAFYERHFPRRPRATPARERQGGDCVAQLRATSIRWSMFVWVRLSACPPARLSVHPPARPRPSVHPSVRLSARPSVVRPSVRPWPSVCPRVVLASFFT